MPCGMQLAPHVCSSLRIQKLRSRGSLSQHLGTTRQTAATLASIGDSALQALLAADPLDRQATAGKQSEAHVLHVRITLDRSA
jgi:hypothetical protein